MHALTLIWALASGAAAEPPPCAVPADVLPEHASGFCAQPQDVRAFVARHDTCLHFAGEEPYDAARRVELERAMQTTCTGNEDRFKTLIQRHRRQAEIRDWLQRYGRDVALLPEG